ncbi:ER membrane protein DP1/Yop1, partial [Borealophlyctis nickersoniae]
MAIFVPSVGLSPMSADDISKSVKGLLTQTDKFLGRVDPLVHLEKELNVHKVYLSAVTTAAIVIICLVLNNVHGGLLTDLCGYLYPSYMSLKAVGSDKREVQALWLGYWSIFGFFNIIEYFMDVVLKMLPFYFTFKLIAIMWLVSPQTQGAALVYDILLKHLIPVFDAFVAILLPKPEDVASVFGGKPATAAPAADAKSGEPVEVKKKDDGGSKKDSGKKDGAASKKDGGGGAKGEKEDATKKDAASKKEGGGAKEGE